ncbi:MAG: hypothetical protein NDJ92_17310, partial [Thermoanaerobaculia bacterium]|nr:hypothetical protein [Thermoanaerobaculia bacterium]
EAGTSRRFLRMMPAPEDRTSFLRREVDFSWMPKARAIALGILWPCTPLLALFAMFAWPYPDPDIKLDYSWSLVLQLMHGSPLVFGRDLALNYGSWGFVFFGYLPETRALVVLSWALLSQLFVIGLIGATRSQSRGFLGLACAWAALALLLMPQPDVRVLSFAPLLFALGAYETDRRHTLAGELALATALGWVVTIKFSTFVGAIPVLIAHTYDQWAFRRRVSPVIPVFFAALVLAQLAAGEPVGAIPGWIHSSIQNVVGYGAAGVSSDRFHEKHPIPLFVAGAAALGFAMTVHYVRTRRWHSIVPLAALAMIFGVLLKASYMRHDLGHQINAPIVFLVFVLCLAPGMVARGKRPEQLLFLVAFGIAVYSANLVTNIDRRRDLHFAVSEQFWLNVDRTIHFSGQEKGMREFHDRKMERIRREYPLPVPIAEPVDIYSYMQSVGFAHGLAMSPRPAFQSYFAWTPFLAGANEKHLRGPKAPATILFAVEPIDGRFPAFEDSLSYPTLLSLYEPSGVTDDFLLLRRRSAPLAVKLVPLTSVDGRIGEPIEVPRSDEPLWATIHVRLSPKGRLTQLVLRPPELRLLATVGDSVEDYRFIPAYGEMGFLISPVVRDHHELRRVFEGSAPGDRAPASFRITTGSADGDRLVCEPGVKVEYSTLRLEWPAMPRPDLQRDVRIPGEGPFDGGREPRLPAPGSPRAATP